MIYYFDSYYENQPFFQQQQVVGALAEFISGWAINYEGKLLDPRKGVLEKKCLGTLKGSESTKKVTV